jgi:hypothetical protein
MNIAFSDLYKKFLEIYWDGDINNALKVGGDIREQYQRELDSDIDRTERFYDFATEHSMTFCGRVNHTYDATEYWCVYLDKVFIVDEGTNILRFEFGGRIAYPKGRTVPCETGGLYTFSGRISSGDFSWSHMNPRHIYAGYGFRNDVDFLCLDIMLDDATCTSETSCYYTGRSFGLPSGEQFRQNRPTGSGKRATASGQGCLVLLAYLASAIGAVGYLLLL